MNNQCDPDYCVAGGIPVSYGYDLAGDMTSYTNGAGVTFTQSFDAAGRPTQVTSNMVMLNIPARSSPSIPRRATARRARSAR